MGGDGEGRSLRVVHYLNQFFAGIGGEEAAGCPPEVRLGPVGPGLAVQKALGSDGEVVATVVCGDNYFAEKTEAALSRILDAIKEAAPDLVMCGPAFNAGRYGMACGAVSRAVYDQIGVPAVTGMYPENPAVDEFRRHIYIVPTARSAAGMGQAIPRMVALARKLAAGETLAPSEVDGYIPRGFRRNVLLEETGAHRAVRMLLQKVRQEPYRTETPLPVFDRVEPAPPLPDLANAVVAIVTEGGLVPRGNPDRIEAHYASRWARYSIADLQELSQDTYECVHGGFDPSNISENPHRLVPLDALRRLEAEGLIGKLHDYMYVTVGNGTPMERCRKFGREIAEELKKEGVQAVVLPAT